MKLSIETLMQEIKPVVMENGEPENQVEPK